MRRRILLADDSVTIQKVIELTFMDEDYDVKAVSNGDEALAALPQLDPDFVIADVHMPGANGYEVCRRSKESRPNVPVLLLVGTFEPFDEGQARAAGADSFLKKPFDSQELLQRVQDLLAAQAPPAAAAPEPAPVFDIPATLPPLDLGSDIGDIGDPDVAELAMPEPEAATEADWSVYQLEPEPAPSVPAVPAPSFTSVTGVPEPFALEEETPFTPPARTPFQDESPFVFEEDRPAVESAPLPAGEPMFDFDSPAPAPLDEGTLSSIDFPEPDEPTRPAAGFAPWSGVDATPEERLGVPLGAAPLVDSLAETEARIDAPAPPTLTASHEPEAAWEPSPLESEPEMPEMPEALPEPVPEVSPVSAVAVPAWATPAPAPFAIGSVSLPGSSTNGGGRLSDEDVDRIARRVVELMGDKTVRDIAWEVIPDLAEVVIRDRLRELEGQVENPAE
jgi:CheY-like chemotaxis protein